MSALPASPPLARRDRTALDHTAAPYLQALCEHAESKPVRLNVPGHKGGAGAGPELRRALGPALAHDVPTLIEGIDIGAGAGRNPLDRALELAADAWGAERTWFLTNGASQGNHALCLALAQHADRVVVQRTVHGSTVDGMVLAGLRPTFVSPEWDDRLGIPLAVTPEALAATLERTPGAAAAIVVSPTYHGACADVRSLVRVAHRHGAALIVDEAWGGHLSFHPELPESALACGADFVISSTHKHVGSLTGSAMLHMGRGGSEWLTETLVEVGLGLVGSTSPSSLLIASLDDARRRAVEHGERLLGENLAALRRLRELVRMIPDVDVLDERHVGRPGVHDIDPLRLTVDLSRSPLDGYAVAQRLREHHVHVELAGERVLVAAFGLGEPVYDTGAPFVAALDRVLWDARHEGLRGRVAAAVPPPVMAESFRTPREALLAPSELVPIEEAVGRVAAQSLAAYPPGVPNVLPGESLTPEVLWYLRDHLEAGGVVRGALVPDLAAIRVCREPI
jgi:arginine decarboxylase